MKKCLLFCRAREQSDSTVMAIFCERKLIAFDSQKYHTSKYLMLNIEHIEHIAHMTFQCITGWLPTAGSGRLTRIVLEILICFPINVNVSLLHETNVLKIKEI